MLTKKQKKLPMALQKAIMKKMKKTKKIANGFTKSYYEKKEEN